MQPLLTWFIRQPIYVRGIIGAMIGAPLFVLIGETLRWFCGRGFFQ